jgi:hypothetical protein
VERLEELIQRVLELAHPDALAGKRGPVRHLSGDEAADLVEALHDKLDQLIEARTMAARAKRIELACGRGCTACCTELVQIGLPEAHAVARFLRRPEQAAARAGFLVRYPVWRDLVGELPARLAAAEETGDRTVYTREMARPECRIMCAFNQGGDCTIYPIRPMLCRKGHAVGTAELCAPHDPALGNPRQLNYHPLEGYVERAAGLLWGAHLALGGEPRLGALCDLVYELVKD